MHGKTRWCVFVSILFVLGAVVLLYIFWPTCAVREIPHKRRCVAHFTLIQLALERYREEHGGHLPPAVFIGPKGHPHSWRLLMAKLLAYPCWEKYRFDEPWDSACNRQALGGLYEQKYHYCYWDKGARNDPRQETTSYGMLVRGKDPSSWDPNSLPPTAVLVVESAECGIRFAEPRDLQYEELWKGDSPFGPGKLHSNHRYVHALRANGQLVLIPKDLSKEDVRLLLDGHPVEGVIVSHPLR